MKTSSVLTVVSRILLAAVSMLASLYCLIAFVPFTYQQVIEGNLLPELAAVIRFYWLLHWLALGVMAWSLYPDLLQRRTRITASAFLGADALFGVFLLLHPVLSGLRNDRSSLWWSCCFLLPPLWVGVIDWWAAFNAVDWHDSPGDDARLFKACFASGTFVAILYSAITYARSLRGSDGAFALPTILQVLAFNVASHLLIFMALFLILSLLIGFSNLFPKSSRIEFVIGMALATALGAIAVKRIVLSGLSLKGGTANLYSVLLAVSLAGLFAGMSLRLYSANRSPVRNGLVLLFVPLAPSGGLSWPTRALSIVLLTVMGSVLAIKTSAFDWNYLLQEVSVLLIWSAAFACFYAMVGEGDSSANKTILLVLAAVAVLGGYKYVEVSTASRSQVTSAKGRTSSVLEDYAGRDVSFRLARLVLSPAPADGSFYRFLAENTNISRSIETKPVDVNLVDKLNGSNSAKPNIVIIVIDSLRRDYLSPYNDAVTFTPAIDHFAHESVIFQNAFARYGGTGLSEPSIWSGGLLLHKQYVMPFAPMNTLEKLLQADHYQAFISRDSILSAILSPSLPMVELDHRRQTMNYDLSQTLKELQEKIDHRSDASTPFFVYTQPENLHISVISREHATIVDNESYGEFYAPYASRLRQIDKSFGEFVQFLKDRGLYDNTIVILTSDHGDSLGEDGRWGHAYTIYPEVLRVPLLVHLPGSLQRLAHDDSAPAFLTDITPSLYYMLGHRPIRPSVITGRPLFVESLAEETQYRRDSYLVASSYGPVYGVLSQNGTRLFIADGVNYRDYLFELNSQPSGSSLSLSSALSSRNHELIRSGILSIDSLYRFQQEASSHEHFAKN